MLVSIAVLSSQSPGFIERLDKVAASIESSTTLPIANWKFLATDTAGSENPTVNDNSWQDAAPGFSWKGENTKVWFRTRLTVPKEINGQPVAGKELRLDLGVDDDGELYIDGKLKEAFHWDDGRYTLTTSAKPGHVYEIAVHGINGPGDGQLRKANLFLDAAPELRQYVTEAQFVQQLANTQPDQKRHLLTILEQSEESFAKENFEKPNVEQLRWDAQRATKELTRLAPITKRANLFYIGHAHIDMNWLWTWPETIDVCRRTWNSAMNLMDEFPDFRFVQSQPGAYTAIKDQYPDEFRRMQSAEAKGQWNLVGGLWDESDTDMPSGEGLARSLLLGQEFFKGNFGDYATTGWLPDSFGHTRQLPQLLKLAGIDSFYHMRCGDGLPLTWWEAPDGSKVMNLNSEPYNDDIHPDQLLRPWVEQNRTGVNQAAVVYGVGDHGGGPTREEILQIKKYADDPVLPTVKMSTADNFFEQLKGQPGVGDLPVIDHDLQYIFTGCYTTRADLKKALRTSENSLYTAETLSSLAAMNGAAYPSDLFTKNWKTTAFAQFHDIACGSAIHSTYDWMLDQLGPAIQTTNQATDAALKSLDSFVQTTEGHGQPIVVWNPLSRMRDDVVRVRVDHPDLIRSVKDELGNTIPAQVDQDGKLVFVARQVFPLWHKVYYTSSELPKPDLLAASSSADQFVCENRTSRLTLDRKTGAIADLLFKPDQWHVFGPAKDANCLEMLGDNGNAWDYGYTGEKQTLSNPDADVKMIESGPVYVHYRVTRHFSKSESKQDIYFYGALDRIDVPSELQWHEHAQVLKLRLPVQAENPKIRVQTAYGSVDRPVDGQECPGQKWMEYGDVSPTPITQATPLDLNAIYDFRSAENFDGAGHGYGPGVLPKGLVKLGKNQVPFSTSKTDLNSVSANGQCINVPSEADGDTLYLLASSSPTGTAGGVRFVYANGSSSTRDVEVNDWVMNSWHNNEQAAIFKSWYPPSPTEKWNPKLWIVSVHISTGKLAKIVLPNEPRMRIFAATIGQGPEDKPVHGLTVLNDSKYGFDTDNGVFRLSLLRSTSDPDTNPDEGVQDFTYSINPHQGDWRDADAEAQGQGLNIPLIPVVTTRHHLGRAPSDFQVWKVSGDGAVMLGALKKADDGDGFIARVYETNGKDVRVRLSTGGPFSVEETDLLERPLPGRAFTESWMADEFNLGHDQIVTLRIRPRTN